MKIISLQAENLKRLVAVEIKPDGALVEITGRNGQGKTSVLDAIWWALEGTTHIQAAPIRKGATEALIRLDLGKLRVTRKFRAKDEGGYTTSILVENEEGARYSSPQNMLDALVGELSFDPLAFTRMKPADQFETLKRFVPGVDFAAIEQANKADFSARTDENRTAKDLRAQAAGIVIPDDAPSVRIDVAALVEEQRQAGEHNADVERQRAAHRQYIDETGRLDDEAHALNGRIAEAKRVLESLQREQDVLRERVADRVQKADAAPALLEPIDASALSVKIMAANGVNEQVANVERRAELIKAAEAAEARALALTKAMEARTESKRKAIAEAKMPVPGIEFGDGAVMLNGVPFDQGSDAEQLRASIAIAAAMNPKLRVVRVRDGSLLDPEAMAALADFAGENDLQVWVETVASGRPGAVLIEDGHVASAAAPALQAAE